MKVAVVGKGGVGKTTVSATLARVLADAGRSVYAIDADPNNCLAYALGFPREVAATIQPLSEMNDLLAERAGVKPGQGGIHVLNPEVQDIIDEHTVAHNGIKLLVMGTIEKGGGGCACPESNTLRAVVRELVDLPDDLVMDMEAGLEHLGRGTARHVDALIAVVAPHASSARTILRIRELAAEIGLKRLAVIANRVTSPEDRARIEENIGDIPVIAELGQYDGLNSDCTHDNEAGRRLLADLAAQLPAIEAACRDGKA
jgi:CO dehydrogenase maturation factor